MISRNGIHCGEFWKSVMGISLLIVLVLPAWGIMQGDVTEDGTIDGRDALVVERHVKGYDMLTTEQEGRADVAPAPGTDGRYAGDGVIMEADALRILYQAVGLIPKGELTGDYSDSAPVVVGFTPVSGPVGTQVTLSGRNFIGSRPEENTVLFGDIPALILQVNGTRLVTQVPSGAVSGHIRLTTPGGSATTPLPFTVTASKTGKVVLGVGLNIEDFTVASIYGETDADPATGEFTLSLPDDVLSLIGAVPKGAGNNSFLALVVPGTAGGGQKRAAEGVEFVIDAHSTARTLIFLHPFFASNNSHAAQFLLEVMETVPAVTALENVIATRYPQGASGLEDASVESAWQQAVIAVLEALPPEMTFSIGAASRGLRLSGAKGASPAENPPVMLAQGGAETQVRVMGIDLDYLKYRYLAKTAAVKPGLSANYSPMDWLVALYRLDPSDMPRGLNESFEDVKKRNIQRLDYTRCTMQSSKQWTSKIDVLKQATYFLMDTLIGWVGLGSDNSLPLQDQTDGIYMLRAYSGAFKDRWQYSGDDQNALKNVSGDVDMANMATGINVVLALSDVWGLVSGKEGSIHEDALKAGLRKCIQVEVSELGSRPLGDYSDEQALQALLKIVVETSKQIAFSYEKAGLSKAQKKLQGSLQEALGRALPLLKVLSKISYIGKIGERIVGLMGYIINPLGLSIDYGPTPLEAALVMVGDPFSPVIESLSPTSGGIGTDITLRGKRFAPKAKDNRVKFGGIDTMVLSAKADGTEITIRVPEGSYATNSATVISVETPASLKPGTIQAFYYKNIPVITELSVTSGFAASSNPSGKPYYGYQGTAVVISGVKLGSPSGLANHKVYFGNAEALIIQQSSTYIRVYVPALASAGLQDLYIVYATATGTGETPRRTFTVWGPPTITSVTPTTVAAGGILDIKGSNLYSTEILINGSQANILEGPPGSELFATMPSTGNPGDALTMELWNPAGSATQTITRSAGIQVPALVALPNGLKYYVGTTDVGLEKNGLISLDEAMKCARGELNFWKDGYDDTNWKYIHHWHEIEVNPDEFTWVERVNELETIDLKTNGLGHETIAHYKVYHNHPKHGGTITEPIFDQSEDLDTGSDAAHKVEEGDRVSQWGSIPDLQAYNGANYLDLIYTTDAEQTVYAGNGILMGPQDRIEFRQTTVVVSSGEVLLQEGNHLRVRELQTSSPVVCSGNHIRVSDLYGQTLTLTGGGITIPSAFGVNVSNVLVKNSSGHGIWIDHGGACQISARVETCTGDGLRLENADQNSITFSASGCDGHGLYFDNSNDNSVGNFSAMNCAGDGFHINKGWNNSLSGTEIANCGAGIVLTECVNFIFQYGMIIRDCRGNGIWLNGGQANKFTGYGGNYPTMILRCQGNGLEVANSSSNWFQNMYIGGNTKNGIVLHGETAAYNRFRWIEVGRSYAMDGSGGTIPLGNGENGVYLYGGARFNTIGEVDYYFNVLGNKGHGVLLQGPGTSYNTFVCRVGIFTQWSWLTTAEGNGGDGFRLTGGASHNQILSSHVNDNDGNGILMEGAGTAYNLVKDSSIGTRVVAGGANPGSRANKGLGIYLLGPANYNNFTNVKVGLHELGGIYCGQLTAPPENGIHNVTFENCDVGWTDIIQDNSGGGGIEEPKAAGTAIGVQLDGCSHSRLKNIHTKQYHTGFHIAGGQPTGLYLNLNSTQCTGDGIYLEGLKNQSLWQLRALQCGGNGIVLKNANTVDWDKLGSHYAQQNTGHGLLVDSCQNVYVQGLSLTQNTGDGLRIVQSSDILFVVNTIGTNGGDGVSILENSSRVGIYDGSINSNSGIGFRIQDSNQVTAETSLPQNNMSISSNRAGQLFIHNAQNVTVGNPFGERDLYIYGLSDFLVSISGDATENVRFLGCSFSGSGANLAQGLLITGGGGITIGHENPLFGNVIDIGAQASIQAEGNVQRLAILNNTIGRNPNMTQSSSQTPNRIGILLQNGITGVVASGNLIREFVSHGVLLRDGAHANAFTNNEIRGNGGDGIRLEGNGTKHNLLTRNIITANDGKGICLAGGNDNIAAPVITNISLSSGAISGSIHPVPPSGSRVEVYADRWDEGEELLGQAAVLGNTFCVNAQLPLARLFHAIVIHPNGNTSEFGPAIPYNKPDWYCFLFTDEFQGRRRILLQNPDWPVPTSVTPDGNNEWDVQADSQGEGMLYTSDASGNPDIWLRSYILNNTFNLSLDPAPDYSSSWLKGGNQAVFVSERDGNPDLYIIRFDLERPIGEFTPYGGEMIKTVSQKAGDGVGVRLTAGIGNIRQLQFYIADLPAAFGWRVLGFEGTSNTPSLVLASGDTTPTLTGWHVVDIPPIACPGRFQVAMMYSLDNQPLLGAAQSQTQGMFYYYTKQLDSWYYTSTNNYMIRVVVDPLPPTRLTSNAANDLYPAWSPDGQTIAFASDRGGSMDIWLMDADGINPRKMTDGTGNNTKPAWSPDGSMIAFVSDRGGNNDIYTIHLDGSNLAPVTNDPADDTDPAWTPDGIFLLFSSNRDGNHEIHGQKPGGGPSQRLTWRPGAGAEPEAIYDDFVGISGIAVTQAARSVALNGDERKPSVFSLDATTTLVVSLSSSVAKPGDHLELTVSIADARDLGNLAFEIAYDSDAIQIPSRPQVELNGGSLHALFPDSYPDASGVLRCNWVHAAGYTGSGVLLRIPIQIKADTQIARTSLPVEHQGAYAIDLDAIPTFMRDGVVNIDLFVNVIWAVY